MAEANYGDGTALAQRGLAQKELPITQGMRPARPGGRPAGGTTAQTPTGVPQATPTGEEAMPDEHRALIRRYVETKDAWEKLEIEAQKPGASMWVDFYRTVARLNTVLLANQLKTGTPDFDVEDPDLDGDGQPG